MSENFAASCHELKSAIRKVVREEVLKFSEKTGVQPTTIDIDVTEVTNHNDHVRQYDITNVMLGFESY